MLLSYNNFISESKKYSLWTYHGTFFVRADMVFNGRLISEKIPYKINGNFVCSNLNLTSLKGCPNEVNGNFSCSINDLTSLIGCPDKINGDFDCSDNNLLSLKGCPNEVNGTFTCVNNLLTTLEEGPIKVSKKYYCYNNKLTSLKGCPEIINDSFDFTNNMIKNLEEGPINISKNSQVDEFGNINNLQVEIGFLKSGKNIDKSKYWQNLLKWMIDEKISLDDVKGWPKGFLNPKLIDSVKGMSKFNL